MPHVVFRYVAIAPLTCGLPDGSIVEYKPGDYVPAEVLGRSIGALILAEKLARLGINVDDDDGPAEPVQPPVTVAEPTGSYVGWEGGTVQQLAEREQYLAEQEDAAAAAGDSDDEDSTDEFPKHLGGGIYELSDGSTARGKSKALAAQAELGA